MVAKTKPVLAKKVKPASDHFLIVDENSEYIVDSAESLAEAKAALIDRVDGNCLEEGEYCIYKRALKVRTVTTKTTLTEIG